MALIMELRPRAGIPGSGEVHEGVVNVNWLKRAWVHGLVEIPVAHPVRRDTKRSGSACTPSESLITEEPERLVLSVVEPGNYDRTAG